MRKQGTLHIFSALVVTIALGISGLQSVYAEKDDEIVLAAPRDVAPGENDFFYTSVICHVWDPLVTVDDEWNPVPGLATSWEMSEDGTEWTFRLREGVRFHDGERFNADAVVANFARYQQANPGKSAFYPFYMQRVYPNFERIEKIDEYTVRLTFAQANPTLLYYMTNFGSPMFSPKCFDEEGKFITAAAGTGPFQVVERVPDQYVVLERFDDYYGEKAKVQRIKIKVIPDGNTRFSALRSEEILGVLDLGAMQPNLANELAQEDRFELSIMKSSITHYLAPNGTRFPFNDVRMRQAVSLTIDRQLIIDEFYGGYPSPAAHILNYASPFYHEVPVMYDPERAKKLAKEVLGDQRLNIDLIMLSSFVKKFPYKEQGEYIQAVLSELGLDISIKIMEFGALTDTMKRGDYDLCMRTIGLPNGEPYSILNSFMRSDFGKNKSYSLGYHNSHVDALLDTAAQTLNMDERAALYTELQELSAQELPFIPLFYDVALLVYNTKLTGYNAMIYGVTLPTTRWVK